MQLHATEVSTGFLECRIPVNLLKSDPTTNALPAILDALPDIVGSLGRLNDNKGLKLDSSSY